MFRIRSGASGGCILSSGWKESYFRGSARRLAWPVLPVIKTSFF